MPTEQCPSSFFLSLGEEDQQAMKRNFPSKTCHSCGRTFAYRKSLKNNWEEVKYCSKACRKRKVSEIDKRIEEKILEMLEDQLHHSSISTSEIAKTIDTKSDRSLFEPIKRAARRLESNNFVIITQDGKRVDSSKAKGHLQIWKTHGNTGLDRSRPTNK